MHDEHLANLLGAASLAVTDLVLAAVAETGGVGSTSGAALVALCTAPNLTVTELGRRVGLTQSAAVRMVDSLEDAALVERRRAGGRALAVRLTPGGRRTARALLAARASSVQDVLGTLDAAERDVLGGLLTKLLDRLYDEVGDADLICRLCDRRTCTRGATCPVGQAERDRGG